MVTMTPTSAVDPVQVDDYAEKYTALSETHAALSQTHAALTKALQQYKKEQPKAYKKFQTIQAKGKKGGKK